MELRQAKIFTRWFESLKDVNARAKIDTRIKRLTMGNPGDCKKLPGGNVTEMRVDYGPGYRVYYTQRGSEIILLLIGGDKRTQQRDIETAQDMSRSLKEGRDDDRY